MLREMEERALSVDAREAPVRPRTARPTGPRDLLGAMEARQERLRSARAEQQQQKARALAEKAAEARERARVREIERDRQRAYAASRGAGRRADGADGAGAGAATRLGAQLDALREQVAQETAAVIDASSARAQKAAGERARRRLQTQLSALQHRRAALESAPAADAPDATAPAPACVDGGAARAAARAEERREARRLCAASLHAWRQLLLVARAKRAKADAAWAERTAQAHTPAGPERSQPIGKLMWRCAGDLLRLARCGARGCRPARGRRARRGPPCQ